MPENKVDAATEGDPEVEKVAYEHLRHWYDEDVASLMSFRQTAHRLMTFQVWMFASTAFALSQIGWVTSIQNVWAWVLLVSAGLGVVLLALGFWYGIRCSEIEDASAVGVRRLVELLETGQIAEFQLSRLYNDLATNFARAINENRDRRKQKRVLATRLNQCTRFAFWFIAVFVVIAIAGNLMAKQRRYQMTGGQNPNGQGTVQPSPTADEAQPDSGSTAPGGEPSAVEPSEVIQHTADPRESSALESSELLPCREGLPEHRTGKS